MSGRRFRYSYLSVLSLALLCAIAGLLAASPSARAQERREREPNSVYAARRAKLAAQVDGPIVLEGFTGREENAQTYIFEQEQNFYYLTGHNEEGAAMVILPPAVPARRIRLQANRAKFSFCRPRIPSRKSGTPSACRRKIPASKPAPASPP